MDSTTRARVERAWRPQPAAERVLATWLQAARRALPDLEAQAQALLGQAGIRLRDVVDHLELPDAEVVSAFAAAGWQDDGSGVLRHDGGMFPPVRPGSRLAVWLRVESVDDHLRVRGATGIAIEGGPHQPLRRALVSRGAAQTGAAAWGVVERNGGIGFEPGSASDAQIRSARIHAQALLARRREFDSVDQGLRHTEALVDRVVGDLGPHWACSLWLGAERDYWMRRCPSGRRQKQRQDALGFGWSNIDHHTYDGSRAHFRHTIRILEKLGYERREMLYAGELAGWGSQVLEQPAIGSTIFADVDLAPHELTVDFAQEELPALPRHRRAGLLSALLGESILEAGLNHVAGLYDQRALRTQLEREGLRFMAPFTDQPHLYQELTTGDWAAVDPARVDRLEAQGHVGAAEAERLRLEGSIVTHLENIERNDGYKGFNRDGIDSVLRKLDPRAYLAAG